MTDEVSKLQVKISTDLCYRCRV